MKHAYVNSEQGCFFVLVCVCVCVYAYSFYRTQWFAFVCLGRGEIKIKTFWREKKKKKLNVCVLWVPGKSGGMSLVSFLGIYKHNALCAADIRKRVYMQDAATEVIIHK